ncbi:MAG: hypothetical protein RSA40_01710 [Malacoplasma sp.]
MKNKKNKDAPSFSDIVGNLPSSVGKQRWFKKKSVIISFSLILTGSIVATGITLPLLFFVFNKEAKPGNEAAIKINYIKSVYDNSNNKVKLIVDGAFLPKEPSLYKVFNITTSKSNYSTSQNIISLTTISETQIALNFIDPSLNSDSIYKLICNGGTSSAIEIDSIANQNVALPTIGFTRQPSSQTITNSATTKVSLSVEAQVISNMIHDKSITFQWYTLDVNTSIESAWKKIDGATQAIYEYDISTMDSPSKKFFKCIIGYEYADSISSDVIHIEKKLNPVISINSQTPSMTLSNLATGITISVEASVANGLIDHNLSYQWYQSNSISENAVWEVITNATSDKYIYNTVQNIQPLVKKYFKCKISYQSAISIESEPIYIERSNPPTLSFNSEPQDVILPLDDTSSSVTLTVDVNVSNPIYGEEPNYVWLQSNDMNGGGTVPAPNTMNKPTYDVQINSSPFKKYYRCIVSYNSINLPLESRYILVEKKAGIVITEQPQNWTLSSSDTHNPRMGVVARLGNQVGIELNYQWYKTNINPTTNTTVNWARINGATNRFYDVTVDGPNKNAWRDTWYKCDISTPNGESPTISSNPGFIKMELTVDEARAEFIKWFTIQSNYESVLATFFNRSTSSNGRHGFYTSLHDYVFTTAPGTVELVSAIAEQFIPAGLTTATTLYKIRLKTTSSAQYRTKASGSDGATTELPVGSFIEFYTLFSFVDNNNQIQRTTDANYNMDLTIAFSTTGQNTTSISWVSNGSNAPNTNNPIKKGSYPVRYISANNVEIFADSLLLPSRPTLDSANITSIPTYNIKTTY